MPTSGGILSDFMGGKTGSWCPHAEGLTRIWACPEDGARSDGAGLTGLGEASM